MEFAGMNYLAVLAAAAASFMFGGIWYGALSKPWMAAVGLDEETIKASNASGKGTWAFITAFVSQLVMAYVLAGVIGHLGKEQVTLVNGLISGAFIWLGFVATTISVNHTFQLRFGTLTLIDTGHWLGVLLIQGAIDWPFRCLTVLTGGFDADCRDHDSCSRPGGLSRLLQ